MRTLTDEQIASVAAYYGLPAAVLGALLRKESGPNLDQEKRFEPGHYRMIRDATGWLAKFHTDDDATNRELATSWGVGQVMGWRLRSLGYKGKFADLNENDVLAAGYAARAFKEDLSRAGKKKLSDFPKATDIYDLAAALYNSGDAVPWPVKYVDQFRAYRTVLKNLA